MKPEKKRGGGVSSDARKLAESQRRLLAEIDSYLAQNDSLSRTSVQGLRQVESILIDDLRGKGLLAQSRQVGTVDAAVANVA